MSLGSSYYFPNLTRQLAEEILSERGTGWYLLRKSSKQNQYAFSVSYQHGIVHSLICWNANTNLYYLEGGQTPECETPIAVCEYLIDNRRSEMLYPVTTISLHSKNNSFESFHSDTPEVVPEVYQSVFSTKTEHENCVGQSKICDSKPQQQDQIGFKGFACYDWSSVKESAVAIEKKMVPSTKLNQVALNRNVPGRCEDFKDVRINDSLVNENYDWFHGQISREEAFKRLSKNFKKQSLNGVFLVRSKSASDFVLDLISDGIHHRYNILRDLQSNVYQMENGVQKSSLGELVDFLRKNSTDSTGLKCQLISPCLKVEKRNVLKKYFPVRRVPEKSVGVERSISLIKQKNLDLKEEIGSGNFGKVKRGIWKRGPNDSVVVAVKILHTDQIKEQQSVSDEFRNEAKIMENLNHPNIVRIFGIHKKEAILVLEFVKGGSLETFLEKKDINSFPEQEKLRITLEILYGMKYLAENKIVHRDLASRNVLLDENNCAKIADFGMARIIEDGIYQQRVLKPGPLKWFAPECLEYAKYTSKSDVWSFGVTMWEIFTYGEVPYGEQRDDVLLQSIKCGYLLKQPSDCSNELFSIMNECWKIEPNERPDFNHLYDTVYNFYYNLYPNIK